MRLCVTVGFALVAAISAGCGTVQNLARESGGPSVYGGVGIAANRFTPGSQNEGLALVVMWPAYTADVVLSALGDTVTLPVTLPLAAARALNHGIHDAYFPNDHAPQDVPHPHSNDSPSHLPPERIHGGIL